MKKITKLIKKTVVKAKKTYLKFDGVKYPRVDATEELPIMVKKQDVDCTKKGDPNKCAIACSIKRTFSDGAFVQRYSANILEFRKTGTVSVRYKLPDKATRAINRFDKTGVFPEGLYILKPFPKKQKLKSRQGEKHHRKPTNTKIVRSPLRIMTRFYATAKLA